MRPLHLNIQRFVVASYCKQVIGDIVKGNQGPYGAIITEIISRSSPLSCTFTFESRRCNFEAHKLAKFALSLAKGVMCGLVSHMTKFLFITLMLCLDVRIQELRIELD